MAFAMLSMALSACSMFTSVPTSLEPPPDAGSEERAVQIPRPPLSPSVDWRGCGESFECADVRVPVDHEEPGGRTMKLALIRLPAPAKADRIGSLIVNPGGPGGSGVDFVRHAAVTSVPAEVRARFDIVGFDPRGVGKSDAVECGAEAQAFLAEGFTPASDTELGGVLDRADELAGSCATHSPELLPHMSTQAVARDLDLIRAAVGDRELTYLGFSYGSTIGLTYAELFGDRVRAMVLDGPVDPAIDGRQRALDQAAVLEKTLREFFRTCPREDECRGFARRLTLSRYDELLERLASQPVLAMRYPGRTLRPAEALMATAALLKDRGTGWPLLAAGISTAENGDGSLLLGVAESAVSGRGGSPQWLAPLLAVNCLDIPAPAVDEYPAAVRQLRARSPHFGPLMLLLASPCSYWSEAPQRRPAPVVAAGIPATVVVGTTGDPTTPYHWAEAVARNLEGATLITRDGETHTAFGRRNVCTDRTVGRYLVDLVVPAPNTRCG